MNDGLYRAILNIVDFLALADNISKETEEKLYKILISVTRW